MRSGTKIAVGVTACGLAVGAAACGGQPTTASQYKQVQHRAAKQTAYLPTHDVELRNYNAAQKLYDAPTSIIYCTALPSNPSAPLVTVPIAGKLTSSSTTFFAPQYRSSNSQGGSVALPSRSVDGLFHPNPPAYRYGFTPGGQYVDFSDIPTICTTALTKFQRQSTHVSIAVDAQAKAATARAEQALQSGDKAKAQQILDALEG